ncbi:MAG: alpha-amylase family glycosyl hydrolase, partial [Bacteroidota bacterium]
MLQIGKPAGVRGRWALPTLLVLVSLLNACRDNPSLPLPQDPTPPYPAYGTPFGGVPDTRDMVMYEVNLRAYSSAGNIQGVINRLDSIKLLGVNVLWLMPLHPVGVLKGINSPYCVRDYKAVGAEYGTLEDLRSLTDAAHSRGMAVLMDWVANHTAWDHPWMANDGWYTQNNQGQVVHPPGTNWLDVADLNYSNQAMRDAMLDAMLYWIYQANIDGFRCDYADGVPFDFWETAWARL